MDAIHEEMTRYFAAEKWESLLFVLVGVLAIGASGWMWMTGAALRGIGYPLVLVGLIQIAVGAGVFLRTDKQVAALSDQVGRAPAEFRAAEVSRMEKVQRNFQIYKAVELGLLLAGMALSYLARRRELWYGMAVGLILQSSVMMVLDLLAEHRGERYLNAVRSVSASTR